MTLLPLSQAGALLGIDPKTLRHWMQQAHLAVHPHPGDARLKCVTAEQLEQLAARHGRPLEPSSLLTGRHVAEDAPPLPPGKPTPQAEAELLSRLAHLETQVALLQQQLAGLALELLQERTARYEHRLHTLETLIQPSAERAGSSQFLVNRWKSLCTLAKGWKNPASSGCVGKWL